MSSLEPFKRIPLHDHADRNSGGRLASGGGITLITSGGTGGSDGGAGTPGPAGADGTDLGWFDVQVDGTVVGDGVTDDTVAIQAAIDTATASGTQSATIYFPPGTYLIGGALQDTGDFNGQILLPDVATADPQITITFLGAAHPPYAVSGDLATPGGYSILHSSLTGSAGTAAVISGGNGTWPTKNNVCVVIKDLICLNPPNPSQTFWNLVTTQGGERRGLYITTTDWDLTPTTEPTHSNAYGIKLPQWGQSNGSQDEFMVGGHYTGFLQGELADVHAIIGQCARGFELPFSEHPSSIHAHVTAGDRIINVTGAHVCDIWIDIEHYTDPPFSGAADWLVTTADLYDPGDDLIGHVRWFSLDGVTQVPDHIFTVNGAANVLYEEMGELPEGTPRGPAGGELGGDYPDPTVATTHSGSTHAGIQSAAEATAAAALAAHVASSATVGIGPLLLSDDHAGPIVFADILQADDYVDFLYADTI